MFVYLILLQIIFNFEKICRTLILEKRSYIIKKE